MESIGSYLKAERESRNISLDEVSHATRIRTETNILTAIEEGQQDLLPSVFTKGFLIAYAKYVGLDPGDVIARYESPPREQDDFSGVKGSRQSLPRKRFRVLLTIFIILLVLVAGLFVLSWHRSASARKKAPISAKPSALQVAPPSPTPPLGH